MQVKSLHPEEKFFEYDINEYQSAKDYISKNIQKYSINLK